MVKTYRKKPVEIEAIQFINNDNETLISIHDFMGGALRIDSRDTSNPKLKIETLEGVMEATLGDYIIKEPFPTNDRNFYPCKPDIFELTYEYIRIRQ